MLARLLSSPVEISLLLNSRWASRGLIGRTWIGVEQLASKSSVAIIHSLRRHPESQNKSAGRFIARSTPVSPPSKDRVYDGNNGSRRQSRQGDSLIAIAVTGDFPL